jgi:branched-chain amino acid transport system ATP-binding protein
MSEHALLQLSNVSAGYGRITVLRGVDITVPACSVVALLGPNGAGKSTCMRVASGLIRPSGGDVFVDGERVGRRSPATLARWGSCCIPEGRGIFPNLTVAENVRLWAYGARKPRTEVAERIYAQFPRLAERRKQMAGSLSGGEQQMLAISRALATDPKVLMLDEISMGIAPKLVAELYDVILGLVESKGLGVLLVEQFADAALAVADRAVVLIHGEVAMTDSPDTVREALSGLYFQAGRTGPSIRS